MYVVVYVFLEKNIFLDASSYLDKALDKVLVQRVFYPPALKLNVKCRFAMLNS